MPKRKTTNKLQRFLLSWPFLVVLAVVVFLVASAAWSMYGTHSNTQESVDRLDSEREELLDRRDSVSAEALDVSSERGLEEEIREKFSVVKEGERVIVLVDEKDKQATSTEEKVSWWRRTLDAIWPFN